MKRKFFAGFFALLLFFFTSLPQPAKVSADSGTVYEPRNGLLLVPSSAGFKIPENFGEQKGSLFSANGFYFLNFERGSVIANGEFSVSGREFVPAPQTTAYRCIGGAVFDVYGNLDTFSISEQTSSLIQIDTSQSGLDAYKSLYPNDNYISNLTEEKARLAIVLEYLKSGENGITLGIPESAAKTEDGVFLQRFYFGQPLSSLLSLPFASCIALGYYQDSAFLVRDEYFLEYSSDISSFGKPLSAPRQVKYNGKSYGVQYFEKKAIISELSPSESAFVYSNGSPIAEYSIPSTYSSVYKGELEELLNLAAYQNPDDYKKAKDVINFTNAYNNAMKVFKSSSATQLEIFEAIIRLEKQIKDKNATFVPVSSIKVNTKKFTLAVGSKKQLVAKISPLNATFREISWQSSNKKILSVSKLGLVKALSPGTAIITAKASNEVSYSISVTVKPAAPSKPKYKYKKSKKSKKEVTISFKKAKGVTLTEIYIKKSGQKYRKIASVKRNSYKVKLKRGSYYARLRCYSIVGGKKYYSSYSKTLKFKIK